MERAEAPRSPKGEDASEGEGTVWKDRRWIVAFLCPLPTCAGAQGRPPFTTDLPPEEFAERRRRVFERISREAIALLQGALVPIGWVRFRQSNEFYHLCGVEVLNAYLLLDGRMQRTSLYLLHRNESCERNAGMILSAEDSDPVKRLTGIDAIYGTDLLAGHLNAGELRDGDLVLMDHSPDVGYDVCEVTRRFSVNGRVNSWQWGLYGILYGAEVLSGFMMEISDIERVMREGGLLQKHPRAFRCLGS